LPQRQGRLSLATSFLCRSSTFASPQHNSIIAFFSASVAIVRYTCWFVRTQTKVWGRPSKHGVKSSRATTASRGTTNPIFNSPKVQNFWRVERPCGVTHEIKNCYQVINYERTSGRDSSEKPRISIRGRLLNTAGLVADSPVPLRLAWQPAKRGLSYQYVQSVRLKKSC
jgi:hypothetical protein